MIGALLLDTDQARAHLQQRIASGQWWVIPWAARTAGRVCAAIEERYYDGDAGADFELLQVPPSSGIFAVALARKTRMSPHQLARLLVELGGGSETVQDLARSLEGQDIPLVTDGADQEARQTAALHAWRWHEWVMQGLGV